MDCHNSRGNEKRTRRRKTSFTEALKEKYCFEDEPTFDFIIVSPKRKTNSSAELAHLQTVVLNDMDITRADIPRQGLCSLCPNVVDLDLANNLFETWSELLPILSHLPKVRYLNVSRNKLHLDLPDSGEFLQNMKLTVENLALNDTGTTIEEVVRISQMMPTLKELHICDNSYESLGRIEDSISEGAFPCLECLRLNNNEITGWSEVWKLRHLPHLKCLVLSGNPISNVFYYGEGRTENNNIDPAGLISETELSKNYSGIKESDAELNSSKENYLQFEHVNSGIDMNGECVGVLIDNFVRDDDGEVEERFDNSDDIDNDRLVNKFEFHAESDISSVSSSDQDQGTCADEFTTSSSDRWFDESTNLHVRSNINMNCQGNFQKSFGEGLDGLHQGYFPGDDVFDNVQTEVNIVQTEDWHRAVAEEFLHEIIDGIDFDDISDQTVPQFHSFNFEYTGTDNYNLQNVHNSSRTDSISNNPANSTGNTTTLQPIPLESRINGTDTFGDINSSVEQYDGFSLGFDPLLSDTDTQFIPRAFRFLDDDVTSSFFSLAAASPPRSRAQRRLFQEPIGDVDLEDTSYHYRGHQSTSDPCSDSEAEQHRREKSPTKDGAALDNTLTSSPALPSPTSAQSSSSSHSKPETNPLSSICKSKLSDNIQESSNSPTAANNTPSDSVKELTNVKAPVPNLRLFQDTQNVESNNNNSVSECSGHGHPCDHTLHQSGVSLRPPPPFQHLQVLCLSSANLHHWSHLKAFTAFPKLTNLRLKNNPLYSNVNPDDRRKLYIASLSKVSVLNGSEVSHMEREKAEIHYLRYLMDKEEKPDFYHALVKKHGPPVQLVDIDLSAGYQEWANLKFLCKGVEEFSRKVHLVEPVSKLRNLISRIMGLPKRCFTLYHYSCGPSHPESERELVELRCESIPMSRFDFSDGDEIHIDFQD